MMINVRRVTMALALALALMGAGVAVALNGGCEGGSTGFCAPWADRAPLVWWDFYPGGIDVGVGQSELFITDSADIWPPMPQVNIIGPEGVDLKFGPVEFYVSAYYP